MVYQIRFQRHFVQERGVWCTKRWVGGPGRAEGAIRRRPERQRDFRQKVEAAEARGCRGSEAPPYSLSPFARKRENPATEAGLSGVRAKGLEPIRTRH